MAEQQQQQPPLRRPRIFKERDVLNELSDRELIKRYRLDRAGIVFVTNLVRGALTRPTVANKALTAEHKIIITLRYLATGKFQLCNGDDLGVSQQTVSRVITETLDALCNQQILKRFIKFPIGEATRIYPCSNLLSFSSLLAWTSLQVKQTYQQGLMS